MWSNSQLKNLRRHVYHLSADEDFTGLHHACYNGEVEVVKLLVDQQQINPNVKDRYGRTALYWCIQNKDVSRVLLESGKLNIQGMNRVKNFSFLAKPKAFQFEFHKFPGIYLIKMDSPTSLTSYQVLSNE